MLGGIIMGLVAAFLWQRFYRTKLPPYLAFFGGRRLVPILTSLAALVISVLLCFVYPAFDTGLTAVGDVGDRQRRHRRLRLRLPQPAADPARAAPHPQLPAVVRVRLLHDRRRPSARRHHPLPRGDPTAGAFMTGFFPIMMFALPAAALAIWHEASRRTRRSSAASCSPPRSRSFLTGVTEPLEFAFMFVALPLYVIHAVLTGTSLALINALGIKDGFSFSAGLFDYVLNLNIATKPLC